MLLLTLVIPAYAAGVTIDTGRTGSFTIVFWFFVVINQSNRKTYSFGIAFPSSNMRIEINIVVFKINYN